MRSDSYQTKPVGLLCSQLACWYSSLAWVSGSGGGARLERAEEPLANDGVELVDQVDALVADTASIMDNLAANIPEVTHSPQTGHTLSQAPAVNMSAARICPAPPRSPLAHAAAFAGTTLSRHWPRRSSARRPCVHVCAAFSPAVGHMLLVCCTRTLELCTCHACSCHLWPL